MQVEIHGKQLDIGEALGDHVRDRLSAGVSKYFDHSVDGQVGFSKQGRTYRADCSVHIGHDIRLQNHAEADEIYASFDKAAERFEKRLRRYKRRLVNHHNSRQKNSFETLAAQSYVLAGDEDEDEQEAGNDNPVVIAEMSMEIQTLTVSDAVMRLQLTDRPAKMFRNIAHGGLNMVYRRPDGNIGWVDPGPEGPPSAPPDTD